MYLDSQYAIDENYCESVTRVTKHEIVVLIAHLLTDESLCFNKEV